METIAGYWSTLNIGSDILFPGIWTLEGEVLSSTTTASVEILPLNKLRCSGFVGDPSPLEVLRITSTGSVLEYKGNDVSGCCGSSSGRARSGS